MKKQKLIEKLEDLASFLTLSQSSAEAQARDAQGMGSVKRASFCSGRGKAYGIVFLKLDGILKEVKR